MRQEGRPRSGKWRQYSGFSLWRVTKCVPSSCLSVCGDRVREGGWESVCVCLCDMCVGVVFVRAHGASALNKVTESKPRPAKGKQSGGAAPLFSSVGGHPCCACARV